MIYIIIIIVVILIIAGLLQPKQDVVFEASFDSPREVASRWNHSFCIGAYDKYLDSASGQKNILICGKSGSGKGVFFILNSLFNILRRTSASIVAVDPGGDNANVTLGYAQSRRKVYTIDFSNPDSYGFNPFLFITNDSEIEQLVHTLVVNSGAFSGGDNFWVLSAENFICFWCKVLRTQEKQYQSFANVLRLINAFATCPAETTDKIVIKTSAELYQAYKEWVVLPSTTMQGIIAQTRACLKIFNNPAVMATTSMAQSIDIDAIRREPHMVYLTTPIPKLDFLRPIIAVFIQSLYDRFLSKLPVKGTDIPVYMILDECSSYYINNFSVYMSNARKFLMPTLIAIQERSSLQAIYKENARNVISNCFTQCLLPGTTDLNTLKEASQLLGDHWRVDNETEKRMRQPLMSVTELSRMQDYAVVIAGSVPTLIKLKPYFASWRFSRYARIAPKEIKTNFSKDIPLIPF